MSHLPFLEFLYAALEASQGTVLRTSDPVRLRAKLYAARDTDPNPDLRQLSLVIPSVAGELWIIKESTNGQR